MQVCWEVWFLYTFLCGLSDPWWPLTLFLIFSFLGSYFARDASYSHNYCQGNSGNKTMFLARVLVGDSVKGQASYSRPPAKRNNPDYLYDSCVDNESDPSIFVVFEKPQIYPEYIMEYKEDSSCCISWSRSVEQSLSAVKTWAVYSKHAYYYSLLNTRYFYTVFKNFLIMFFRDFFKQNV